MRDPHYFSRKLFSQAYKRVWVASPGLEGGQVAVLRLYTRSGCSILLYRGGRITQMG
jgi:hypothetical protein